MSGVRQVHTGVRHRLAVAWAMAVLVAAVVALMPRPAAAAIDVTAFDGGARYPGGAVATQAGAHADVSTEFTFAETTDGAGNPKPVESIKDLRIQLPAGLIGNPSGIARCRPDQLAVSLYIERCPIASQVGTVLLRIAGRALVPLPVYNMVPRPGVPAQLGFNAYNVLTYVTVHVGPGPAYRLVAQVDNASETLPLLSTTMKLWGVPADPAHDGERGWCTLAQSGACPSPGPVQPFMTLPVDCSAGPLTTDLDAASWQEPGAMRRSSFVSHLDDGTPAGVNGCEKIAFDPSIEVQPDQPLAGRPSGLTVRMKVPQDDNPQGLSVSTLRKAVVTLPEGVVVSPSAAAGLQACSLGEIGLTDTTAPACPQASRIGHVEVVTPLLDDPLKGAVYLAKQRENPFSTTLAIYLTAAGPGVQLKLAGRVDTDANGRVRTTFDDNPQLPFSELTLAFDGGDRAALALPATCGPATTTAELTPYSSSTPVVVHSTFDVTGDGAGGCAPRGFAPAFRAGSTNASAGSDSAFTLDVARTDRDQELGSVTAELPRGLLARVGDVPLCAEAQANAGSCDQRSLVGAVRTTAGPGATPTGIAGRVYLTGPYKGAPFGLSIVVPAVAGPFDLGTVVVRAAIEVDPRDAHVTVRSDPLPTILEGIPLQVRSVAVTVDRLRFMINPTSCTPMRVAGRVASVQGTVAQVASRFQVGGCAALPLSPVIAARGGGKGNTKRFTHPSLQVTIRQSAAQAHLDKANVVLPKAFNVDLNAPALKAACPRELYAQDKCSKVATVGRVKAVTPVFKEPLSGPVFLLQKKGQLPDVVMRLRNVHYAIDLIGVLDFLGDGRVITRVKGIPDAPITSFELTIKGGRIGSLLNRADLCAKRAATQATFRGQNGKVAVKTPTTRIDGCPPAKAAAARAAGMRRSLDAAGSADAAHRRAAEDRS